MWTKVLIFQGANPIFDVGSLSYYFCFEDHDFLPSQLSNMVMMYLRNPELVETFLQYDNLDDYLDLMECDLRERYLEVRHMSENRNHTSLSQNIIMELCSVIRRFQKRIPHFVGNCETGQ